jgi:succinate dehydrogenase / fumarate reductase, membrane anchor subunit
MDGGVGRRNAMSEKSVKYVSPLARAKGLGSAKKGASHWMWQRLTALIIAPLGIWLVVSLVGLSRSGDIQEISDWMASPYNALFSTLFLGAMFMHAKLGLQVVIEDYIHCHTRKMILLLLVKLVFIVATIATVMSVGKLHFMS